MNDVTRLGRCARCGDPLPVGVSSTGDLCARCSATLTDTPTRLTDGTHPADVSEAATMAGSAASAASEHETVLSASWSRPSPARGPRPVVGSTVGPYRIERPLGSGGMGDVYAVEHLEHGRRLALKVLGQQLAGAEDRARFFREGEIAASITHPNTVYIYGSDEIDGSPVIAMELLPGGTLKDLVRERGPLPPREAVDLILQVIAGLEAAHAAGILHRDIKPANCFVDRDGGVKVGDFGLSIATSGREAAATGFFQGTPQFAPPEQLRGEALDVRADIYAVGATLFYLLTGQPPFNDPDLTTLVSRVKDEPARSPREMRASVPVALAAVVTRCLAKDRADRPTSYAMLREQLRSFSSTAIEPAPVVRRVIASLIDQAVLVMLGVPLSATLLLRSNQLPNARWWLPILHILMSVTYYAVCEGQWGAAIGKALAGVVVARPDGARPGVPAALVRAALFQMSALLMLIPLVVLGPEGFADFTVTHPALALVLSLGAAALQVATLFSTARRANGYAGLHDLASGTRVIRRVRATQDVTLDDAPLAPHPGSRQPRTVGPFEIAGSLGRTEDDEWWLATDARLKRRVWILERAPGSPPMAAHVRDMGRPARLRWLGGRRTDVDAWDAFEAFDGAPLVSLGRPQSWRLVKRWLVDLAVEIDAGLADGSLPPLTIDRVWITAAGRAKLLDFPTPGSTRQASLAPPPTLASAEMWLARVVARGLNGRTDDDRWPPTLPLSARATLDRLGAGAFATSSDIVSAAKDIGARADEVPRARRALTVVLCATVPIACALLGGLAAFALHRAPTGIEALGLDLQHLATLPDGSPERQALETYVAAEYRSALGMDLTWSMMVDGKPLDVYRPVGRRIVAEHPTVSREELDHAKVVLGPFLAQEAKVAEGTDRRARIAPFVVPTYLVVVGFGLAAIGGFVLGLVCRGGLLLRAFGIAVVTSAGREVTRWHAMYRSFVAWAPAAFFVVGVRAADITFKDTYVVAHPVMLTLGAVSLGAFLVGAAIAASTRSRGLQDRLARTRLVPR